MFPISLLVQLIFTGFLLLTNLNWKNYIVPCSENYNSKTCLYMKILLTFLQVQGQENLQNTTVNIYLYRSLYLL